MTIVNLILAIITSLFPNNATVAELIPLLEQAEAAFNDAKAGKAFNVSFSETIDGVAGMSSLSWTPTPPPAS